MSWFKPNLIDVYRDVARFGRYPGSHPLQPFALIFFGANIAFFSLIFLGSMVIRSRKWSIDCRND
jgi:hypothetical protein